VVCASSNSPLHVHLELRPLRQHLQQSRIVRGVVDQACEQLLIDAVIDGERGRGG
jgi:hypothetical protein